MIRLKRAARLTLAACLLSSCMPLRPHVLATLPKPPTSRLRLALVITDQTKAAVKKSQTFTGKSTAGENFDQANKPFDAIAASLQKGFDSVKIVDNVEQARAAKADLLALLTVDTHYRAWSMGQYLLWALGLPLIGIIPGFTTNPTIVNIDVSVAFKTLDQTDIDTVKASSHFKIYHHRGKTLNYYVPREAELVAWKIEEGLVQSRPLAEFARAAAGARQNAVSVSVPVATTAGPKGPHSDVDSAAYESAEDPNKFALVVGVEKYGSLPEARFAERDAAAMREHLIGLGYPVRNILYLAGERASRAGLEKYIESWLPRNVNEESKVFVYFSGHGAPDAETRQVYLVPWDGDPKFLKDTAYPLKRLYEKLNALKAKEVVVAMDSCFSGAGGRSVLAQGTRPLVTKLDLEESNIGRLVVFAASSGEQVTGADEQEGHGLFTYSLLKALNDRKGEVTVKALYSDLLPRVKDAARRQNREQTPQLFSAGEDRKF